MEVEQPETADFLTAMTAEEFDQAMSRRDIGPNGVRRAPSIMGKMASPARGQGPRRMFSLV